MNTLKKLFRVPRSAFRVCAIAAALLPACSPPAAQAATDIYGTPVIETNVFFTNMLAGVGGLKNTNALFQFTNGSTTVTSAPVALRGYGFALESDLSPTNALLTNIVHEFRFSMDGVNWAAEPTFTWRSVTAAIAAGKYLMLTNVLEDAYKNFKYVQHWKVHLTNGANTVGSAFSTNRPPVRIVQRYDNL